VNEALYLAQVSSPYVVEYYDSFLDPSFLHIIMEYADGGFFSFVSYLFI
jgi:serine/threonine protein kinase